MARTRAGGREYALCSATEKIPIDGLPAAHDSMQTVLHAGEYILTVAVRLDRLGKWKLTIDQENSSISSSISERDAAWLVDSPGYSTSQAGAGATVAAEDGKPFVLVRVNGHAKAPASGIPTGPNATTDGILIWVTEWNENSLQPAPATSGNKTAADGVPEDAPMPAENE